MVKNFRRADEKGVALAGAPQSAAEVEWLREQGIGAVCSLHPVPAEAAQAMQSAGIAHLDFPVADFSQPLPGEMDGLLRFVTENAANGVLIH